MEDLIKTAAPSRPRRPSVLLTSEGLGWSGLAAEFRRIPAGATKVAAGVSHRLGMHVGPAVTAACRCDGQIHRRVQSEGEVDFVPAGLDGEWEDAADCSILTVRVGATLIRRAAEDLGIDPDRMTLSPRFQLRDLGLQHILWALKAELEAPASGGRLFVDGLGSALACKLVRLQGDAPRLRTFDRQTLSPLKKRRLEEFIETHLDRDLSLCELAGVAGVGLSQLKALFPRSFGLPVHQYVLHRRVERARNLLLSGDLPISRAALESGFAHQSHMARWLKRMLGLTPRQIVAMRR